jgi:hypothetical protein
MNFVAFDDYFLINHIDFMTHIIVGSLKINISLVDEYWFN